MNLPQIRIVHDALAENDWVAAAQLALRADQIEGTVTGPKEANHVIRTLLRNLLMDGDYILASALGWGENFSQEPECVRRVFGAMTKYDQLLIMAGASMGKTYGAIAWTYLDWLLDPHWTSVKLTSRSEDHLRQNVWSHLLDLHNSWLVKPEGEIRVRDTDMYLGMSAQTIGFGFNGIAFTQSAISSGAWKGFKPQPKRPPSDPNYVQMGKMTRLRIVADEAQQYPSGPFLDLYSVMGSMGGGRVKIVCCFNPESISQVAVQKAEPPDGWKASDLDTLFSWESKEGWHVERMDAAKSENVMTRKELFPGLQTYDRYISFLQGGGDHSASYYCFARGYPPMEDSAYIIIPAAHVQSQIGEAIYIDRVANIAAVDVALQGQDKACMGIGRWGLASGWKKAINGQIEFFVDPLNPKVRRPRWVMMLDQMFKLPRSNDTVQLMQEITGRCKTLEISPEFCAIDGTGNAMGVVSHAMQFWGGILPVYWNEGATDRPVLFGDKVMASALYDGIPSELWFSARRWLDPIVNAIIINPLVGTNPLNSKVSFVTQLTSRRFRFGKKLKVESKDEYRARNGGMSPDEADVLVMMVHLCKMRGGALPGIGSDISPERGPGGLGKIKPIRGKPSESAEDIDDRLEIEGDEEPRGRMEVDN